ncbi:MAG TPA: pyridine nucleotide-disulfide oxidoreductase, partial [Polyangiaceae bacterium]
MSDATASPTMPLGIPGFTYADLHDPLRLAELAGLFERWFAAESGEHHARFEAYRACKGEGMSPTAVSEALLAAAPYVGHFVARLFGIEKEAQQFRDMVRRNDPLWRFKKDFAKKRLLRDGAGKGWTRGPEAAEAIAKAALQAMTPAPVGGTTDEERTIATAALPLLDTDDVARRAAKGGGAEWTDELRSRARKVQAAVAPLAADAVGGDDDASLARVVAFALDALEAWLAHRRLHAHDPVRRWSSLHVPKSLDWTHLV